VRVAHQDRTDTAMAGPLRDHVAALEAAQVAVTPLLRAGAPRTVLAQVASEVDAALVLVGTPQARQGFVSALGGSYEALQAALPCPVYCVTSPAAGDPRGWALVLGGVCDDETAKQRPVAVFPTHRGVCVDTGSAPALSPGGGDRDPQLVRRRACSGHALPGLHTAGASNQRVPPLGSKEPNTFIVSLPQGNWRCNHLGTSGRDTPKSCVACSVRALYTGTWRF
jgi:hypothetical protein